MAYLHLPRSLADERAQINAEQVRQVYTEYGRQWTEEIKRIDPTLEVVRAKDNATDPDLIPGRWYILKHIPGSVDAYIELPKPPGTWLYGWLSANDMWNPRVHRSKKEAAEKLRAAKVRARKLEAEQRTDHMAEAVRAARRMRGDGGLTRSSQAKREGKGL
jgi:hypothetical protein